MSVRQLQPRFVERVWGTTKLAPLFPDQDRNIGEVWFQVDETFPLLVKFIFTSERLSVQVHPDDSYARRVENSRGKTEMWHILAAEPGATIALGFRERVTETQLRQAIAAGTIEELMNRPSVSPGEAYFAGAGTIHAIGPGISLCEIQQNSDVTYRLFDYGRGRELHLEKGLQVLDTDPYQGRRDYPIQCDHFTTELLDIAFPGEARNLEESLLIVLSGSGRLGDLSVQAGHVYLVQGEGSTLYADTPLVALRATWSP